MLLAFYNGCKWMIFVVLTYQESNGIFNLTYNGYIKYLNIPLVILTKLLPKWLAEWVVYDKFPFHRCFCSKVAERYMGIRNFLTIEYLKCQILKFAKLQHRKMVLRFYYKLLTDLHIWSKSMSETDPFDSSIFLGRPRNNPKQFI